LTYNVNEIVSQLSDFITSCHGLTDEVDHERIDASHNPSRLVEEARNILAMIVIILALCILGRVISTITMEWLQDVLVSWLRPRPTALSAEQTESEQAACSLKTDVGKVIPAVVDRTAWSSITTLQQSGRPGVLEKILLLYLTDSQQLADKLRQGMAAGEAQIVNEATHSLKSRSTVFGATSLSDLCRQIEAIGHHCSLRDTEPLLDPLEATFAAACHVFEATLERRAA
jgi:HPt (histidine-containing phosphotransfer) domain-containing protein